MKGVINSWKNSQGGGDDEDGGVSTITSATILHECYILIYDFVKVSDSPSIKIVWHMF